MRILCHTGLYKYRIALTFVKPRGGEGQNGRLKCPFGFFVFHGVRPMTDLWQIVTKSLELEYYGKYKSEMIVNVRNFIRIFVGSLKDLYQILEDLNKRFLHIKIFADLSKVLNDPLKILIFIDVGRSLTILKDP